jgi:hypothetical protein
MVPPFFPPNTYLETGYLDIYMERSVRKGRLTSSEVMRDWGAPGTVTLSGTYGAVVFAPVAPVGSPLWSVQNVNVPG